MKTIPSLLLVAMLGVAALVPTPGRAESPRPDRNTQRFITLAVLDFESSVEGQPRLGAEIGSLLTTFLSSEDRLITVERAELETILSEQELALSGAVDARTAAVVGQLTGAKVLVTGRAFVMGNDLVVAAKIISTETGRVFGEAVVCDPEDPPAGPLQDLAEKIAATIVSNASEMLAVVESRDELVERLRGVARKRALPTVSVSIKEKHIGSPRFAPTAATEISHLLQEVGFQLVDRGQSTTKADVEITGNALSQFGARHGDLVSCRGSVEIKAVGRKAGAILAVDHQSEVAVDLAERFASRSALQLSAARLVERLVEKLAAAQ